MLAQLRAILDEPLQATLEPWQLIDDIRIECFNRKQRRQPYHRTNFQGKRLTVLWMEDIIVEAILWVP